MSRLRVIPRAEWGARTPSTTPERVPPGERRAVMLHYSTGQELGRLDTAQWVREIQRYHLSKGWADVGYSFLVDAAGRVYEGRGWDYAGAHCTGRNRSAWGVCFLGNDDAGVADLTAPARLAILAVVDEAQARAGRRLERLGHRDAAATACPGDEAHAWLRAGMPSPTAQVPPATAAPRVTPPPYPLPPRWYFGPREGPRESVSGYAHPPGHPYRQALAAWQRRARALGYAGGADGFYGRRTADAARSVQRRARLRADGLIGPDTWAAAWTSR